MVCLERDPALVARDLPAVGLHSRTISLTIGWLMADRGPGSPEVEGSWTTEGSKYKLHTRAGLVFCL